MIWSPSWSVYYFNRISLHRYNNTNHSVKRNQTIIKSQAIIEKYHYQKWRRKVSLNSILPLNDKFWKEVLLLEDNMATWHGRVKWMKLTKEMKEVIVHCVLRLCPCMVSSVTLAPLIDVHVHRITSQWTMSLSVDDRLAAARRTHCRWTVQMQRDGRASFASALPGAASAAFHYSGTSCPRSDAPIASVDVRIRRGENVSIFRLEHGSSWIIHKVRFHRTRSWPWYNLVSCRSIIQWRQR